MRVTQSMLTNNMLSNMSKSYEQMGKYQEQLSTGKKISRPSDDPVVAMKGMNYRSQLTEIEQFQRNIGEVHNWMNNSDAALDKTTKALQRLRELAVQASNDTYETGQRENIAEEVKQLKAHLKDLANTKVNNKYIFNGTNTSEPPVTVNVGDGSLSKNFNQEFVNMEVSAGTKLNVNVDGNKVFGKDLFANVDQFIDNLSSGEGLEESIAAIDRNINDVVNTRADLGARMNRVELVEDRLSSQEVMANRILSDNEDAELEKVITKLKTQESVHRAALSVGARIIQPTLMDFLR
ncbi:MULTISPECIES: flagellar hook-associated protein FlgL [Pontibacillus]|uniref:Flagellar hook-associated protein FlgL n=1 Tax=Pontibacillus chungwhensis TaxID=265426 RepID=A0ABY8V8X2_9BACI|nr:flagellar hook-associated protein FlgL [Pontibacillus chungwhensis]MCD5325911.1 flagellar hook-associated protein FlgL [Pontibacillus sp. HN14]WIG00257.1 flagellar hook-associated protein FlgL [Pontibacillus chungwhensis]